MKIPCGQIEYAKHKGGVDRVIAPMREVVRVLEVVGPKGGVLLVHVLECTHWLIRRRVAKRSACVGCAVEKTLQREARA